MNADRIARRGPSRPRTPKPTPCYACSMPAQLLCEFPGCQLPLCAKHVIRKFGGHLCKRHEGASLVQHKSEPHPHESDAITSKPATRFRDAGETKAQCMQYPVKSVQWTDWSKFDWSKSCKVKIQG